MSASPGPGPAGGRDGPGPVAAVRRPWLTRNVAVLCGVSFLQDTASELLYPILPVFLTAVLGAPVAVVGIAEGAAALAKVAAGRRADRTGRRQLIAAGYRLAAAGKVLIAQSLGRSCRKPAGSIAACRRPRTPGWGSSALPPITGGLHCGVTQGAFGLAVPRALPPVNRRLHCGATVTGATSENTFPRSRR